MDFKDALYNRRNISSWLDTTPPKEKIDEIIKILHDCSPSKQSKIRYDIDIIDNSNFDKRLQIYKACKADTHESNPTGRYNPQVLAPWLISFSEQRRNQSKPSKPDIYLDIGIATATISYTASALGLDTGLCRCITYEDLAKDVLGYRPIQFIGIGYKSSSQTYYCPVYKKQMPNIRPHIKPDMNEYVQYVQL
jgi:nitroreductase